MLKRILHISLIISIILTASIFFHLPTRAVYGLLPLFLKFRYGISMGVGEITGGFKDGIALTNVKLSSGATSIGCGEVVTDIKFLDFLFPNKEHRHNIHIDRPRINVQSGLSGFIGVPLYLNTLIFISDAELFIEDFPVRFTGGINIDNENIEINKMNVMLGELELQMEGGIDSNKTLNLYANFVNSENKFLIKGTLNKPQIETHWGDLETLFRIEDMKYDNGQLVLPMISGDIYIEGFPPIDLDGGLCITKDFIRFNNMTIMDVAQIDGVINKDKSTMVRLHMDNIEGVKLYEDIPEVLRFLILSHMINADVNVYGMMDNLQAGGVIGLLSTPMEIACRYRHNRFSFRSLGDNVFSISGSIDWANVPTMNPACGVHIKGIFNQMDIKEFMSILGKTVDSEWKGIVDGEFKISGELKDPIIESKLEIENAELGGMKFDVAYLDLEGYGSGPLNIRHSMVYYKDVPAEITGYIDPKGGDIFKNIEIHPTGDGFIWEDVNITKDDKGNIVIFGKDVDKNISVRFKSALTSDSKESEEEKPEVELEYKLKDDKNLLIKMQEDEGTIGVEHKVKF